MTHKNGQGDQRKIMTTVARVTALITVGQLLAALPLYADTIILTGVVWDFREAHPDFETFNHGGLVTGLVSSSITPGGKPHVGPNWEAGITSSNSFSQWYASVPGTNAAEQYGITLDNGLPSPGGVYTYESSSFFPIDNRLFGNEGNTHNYHFTFEIHTTFTYSGGESFTFRGDDDLWVYIDGKLAVDLGGVKEAVIASVNLDSLGLITNETYAFDLFFAERHTVSSQFRIDTTIALEDVDPSLAIYHAVELEWFAPTGRNYQVQWCSFLDTNTWYDLGVPVVGTEQIEVMFDSIRDVDRRFYRVVSTP